MVDIPSTNSEPLQPPQQEPEGTSLTEKKAASHKAGFKGKPSIERTKEFFPAANLSDKEAEDICDIAHMFAELAFEAWDGGRKKS